jgi:hypothetical protein
MDGMSIRVVKDGRDMDNMWSNSSVKLRLNTIDGFFKICIQYPLSSVHSSTNNELTRTMYRGGSRKLCIDMV